MLVCVAVLAAAPVLCCAEPTVPAPETVIRLTVEPMTAPKPALRYRLLPTVGELHAGNPIQGYLLCMLEQQTLFEGDAAVRRDKLLALPLNELPAKELEDYGGPMLRLADRAARMDKPDWQIVPKLKTDGINTLLPDVQQMRQLAQALQLRFRAETALRRFDASTRTAKTMFALARHMGEHPTLIGDLVAMAIAFIAIAPLEEMLEQPGCPNLYWALTNLPTPLISVERGMEGDRLIIQAEFPGLDSTMPMTREEIRKALAKIDLLRVLLEDPTSKYKTARAYFDAKLAEKGALTAARKRLVEVGFAEEELKALPGDQVLLMDEKREYEIHRDDTMKLVGLPAWQAEEMASKIKPSEKRWLLVGLVPATRKVLRAQGRLEQRIALLRHVEALRLYAAEHDGKLPAKLGDCSVPLPHDPFTGKPFLYKLEGATAHLRGSPPYAEKNNPAYNIHYEVTIRK
jgi:hypothetical protein